MDKREKDFWETFVKVQMLTKKYYIRSEEYGDDFCSVLQPIKEQRDALDHISRAYREMLELDPQNLEVDGNFGKALGHIFRAFFDTADILSIVLRENSRGYWQFFLSLN